MSKTVKMNFDSTASELNLRNKVFLEDLFDDDNESASIDGLKTLRLSIGFDNGSPAETEALYTRAVQNLKKIAPNLSTVYFDGGYIYNPVDNNSESFREELRSLHQHFNSLSKIFRNQNLPVSIVNFQVELVFERYAIDGAFDLINELFEYKLSDNELESHIADFTYTSNDIPFQIRLFFNVKSNEPGKQSRRSSAITALEISLE